MGPLKLIILLLLAFMIVTKFSQRGGGGRSKRSSSSRGGSKGGLSALIFGQDEDQQVCKTVKGKTKCINKQGKRSDKELGLVQIGSIVIALIYGIYTEIQKKRENQQAKEKQKIKMSQFEVKHQTESAQVSSQQKKALIAQFKKTKFTIKLNTKDKSEKFICNLKDINLKEQGQHSYKIKMKGKDEVGSSILTGLLMFKAGGLRIMLSKQYNNKQKAGQTGKYRVLFYQEQGAAEKLEGKWAYHGFQNSKTYSGEWCMMQFKDQSIMEHNKQYQMVKNVFQTEISLPLRDYKTFLSSFSFQVFVTIFQSKLCFISSSYFLTLYFLMQEKQSLFRFMFSLSLIILSWLSFAFYQLPNLASFKQ